MITRVPRYDVSCLTTEWFEPHIERISCFNPLQLHVVASLHWKITGSSPNHAENPLWEWAYHVIPSTTAPTNLWLRRSTSKTKSEKVTFHYSFNHWSFTDLIFSNLFLLIFSCHLGVNTISSRFHIVSIGLYLLWWAATTSCTKLHRIWSNEIFRKRKERYSYKAGFLLWSVCIRLTPSSSQERASLIKPRSYFPGWSIMLLYGTRWVVSLYFPGRPIFNVLFSEKKPVAGNSLLATGAAPVTRKAPEFLGSLYITVCQHTMLYVIDPQQRVSYSVGGLLLWKLTLRFKAIDQ